MYEIVISQQAERDLRRLAADIFQRIVPEIEALAQVPRPTGCRKLTGSKSDYSIRIGDYRVLYEIDDKEKVVRIMRVRHRRESYR